MMRQSFPNPDRAVFWPGEEDHYRDQNLHVGTVVRYKHGALGQISAFNNTWSHMTGGRLVHIEPVGPGYGHTTSWESDVELAEPADHFGAHPHHAGCPCGVVLDTLPHWGWVHMAPSWEREATQAHRQHSVTVALRAMLPEPYTWTERADRAWLDAFPCGIAAQFEHDPSVSVSTERIVANSAHLDEWKFELYLDACVNWVTNTMTAFRLGEPVEDIVDLFTALQPDGTALLRAIAQRQGMTFIEFMGAGSRV